MCYRRLSQIAVTAFILSASLSQSVAGKTTVSDALQLEPIQRDVVYDRPQAKEAVNCQLTAEQVGTAGGWVVRGPAGQVLRRFLDTNSDNKVDQWCYFHNGVEVYRDIDGDFNEKADQYRWLGTGGMRWGLDKNEDGIIDQWKVISAEEVIAELISALRRRDNARFQRLLLPLSDVSSLGLSKPKQEELAQKLRNAASTFSRVARQQRVVGPKTEWIHFGGTQPGILPAGTDGSSRDLVVYDSVMAIVETDGTPGQLAVGSLLRVGDAWRMIDLPVGLLEGQANRGASGFFFAAYDAQPNDAEIEAATADAASHEIQQFVARLEKLEGDIARAISSRNQAQLNALNDRRTETLENLARHAKTQPEREVWIRQLADTISASVQAGTYPNGMKRLEELLGQLDSKGDLAGYVKFRYMTAGYATSLQDPNADFAKIQEDWLKQLEEFVEQYSRIPDASEAMLQLAIAEEFAGNEENARKWYQGIVDAGDESLLAQKAQGAVRRLDSIGKSIRIRGRLTDGQTFDLASRLGRIVLVHYWATWCEPCKQDLTVLQELHARYSKRGFAAVGVNLDNDPKVLSAFLRKNRLKWPQLYESGGLDGRLAVELGVLTLPTMILIDQKGNVLNRNIHVSELETELRKRLR